MGTVGLLSVSRHNGRPVELDEMHVTDTPSRVPEIYRFGMGFNNRSASVEIRLLTSPVDRSGF